MDPFLTFLRVLLAANLLDCLDFPNKIPCLHAKLRIPFFTVLQIRFFKMAGDFFIWQAKIRIAKMIMSRGLEPQWGLREKIQDNFLILKMSKFDIGLETAKVKPCWAVWIFQIKSLVYMPNWGFLSLQCCK